MSDPNKSLKDALVKAIQAEIEGHNFYLMAARTTDDVKGKEVFGQMAADETEHAAFLKGQYRSIIESGSPDKNLKLNARTQYADSSPIFSDSLKSRAGEAHFEVTALSIAIQLELNALNFYRSQSRAADNDIVRNFFAELAEWEMGHYKALLKQHDLLKEDYWNAAGFAPF
ncbi:MAG: ferritin family protein [FCB group bacterium]|nr:ferritin family protein [FCB group bacterium]